MSLNLLTKYPKTSLFVWGCLSALAMAPVYFWSLMAVGYTVLMVNIMRNTGVKAVFLHTWVFFFAYFMASLYWVSHALTIDIHLWWWALPLSFTGLPVLLALFPAVLITAVAAFRQRVKIPVTLSWALFVTALFMADCARSHLFTGFPWNLPLHTWAKTSVMMDVLPLIGFYPLNLLTLVLFTLPALIIISLQNHDRRATVSAAVIIVLSLALIFATSKTNDKINAPTTLDTINQQYQIHMIQANIAQDVKWDPRFVWQNFTTYLDMSLNAVTDADKPALIIWPETATSLNLLSYKQANEKFTQFLQALPEGSLLVTGFLNSHYQYTPARHYNSIAVFNTDGEIVAQYDKHHLVPFGEFIPFQSYIPISTVTGFEGFQAGAAPRLMRLGGSYNLNILPLICYEIIFPRTLGDMDGGLIINTTNDAWFGKTAGAYQHFDHAIFRAKENNIAVLRLSGNGISAMIDSDGQITAATLLNHRTKISRNTP